MGLCELTAQGRPDWGRAEQVELLAIDVKHKVIRVRRACFGPPPGPLPPAGPMPRRMSSEGPWGGPTSRLLWLYNYATCCPRDAQGRTCADVLADDLAAHFAPGGDLAAFDGLEFDVLYNQPVGLAAAWSMPMPTASPTAVGWAASTPTASAWSNSAASCAARWARRS